MRPAVFAALCVAPLLACEPDSTIVQTAVEWMDWPAEVVVGAPFRVRLVVWRPCAAEGFRAGPAADQSAVTFSPYFLRRNDQAICALEEVSVTSLTTGNLDTAGVAPGLRGSDPRTFDMRATTFLLTVQPVSAAGLPVRTFGDIIVQAASDTGQLARRRNAGGTVQLLVDSLGCPRLRPGGLYSPNSTLVLENPIDTAGLSGSFVRGYVYEPAAPVCGEARVFHLLTRN